MIHLDKILVTKPKVMGHILDKLGDPILGVTVQVGDNTTGTDEISYWEMTEMAKGEYTVTAHKDGYTFVPQTITIEDDDVVINLAVAVDQQNDLMIKR